MHYLLVFLFTFAAATVCDAEIVTVAVNMAEVQSRPSETATYVVVQAPRYYPLSVQSEKGDYYQVRDYQGLLGWIHKSLVSNAKGVVVEVDRANVRSGPGTNSPITFHAYKGVTFKVLAERDEWLKIIHEGGAQGWIFKPLTWGR